jgi:hypothetical protein
VSNSSSEWSRVRTECDSNFSGSIHEAFRFTWNTRQRFLHAVQPWFWRSVFFLNVGQKYTEPQPKRRRSEWRFSLKVSIFWHIAPCSRYMSQPIGWVYHLLQGRKSAEQETSVLARLTFNPEDVGNKWLQNIGSYMDYTTLHPRRWQSEILQWFLVLSFSLHHTKLPLPPPFYSTLNNHFIS